MPQKIVPVLKAFTSLQVTLWLLIVLMVLVLICTLAQVRLGTFQAVDMYIRSLFVYWTPEGSSLKIPIFPGGGLVGLLLMINLVVSQFYRMELSWRKAGLWVVHAGLILMFFGEFVTGFFQVETNMAVMEGEARNYTESTRAVELAVIDATDPRWDEVIAFPESRVAESSRITHAQLPFTILVKRYFPNSRLERRMGVEGAPSMATTGIGTDLVVFEEPVASRDDQGNIVSAFIELFNGDRSLGSWLVSSGLGLEQPFFYMGRSYRLAMRQQRHYLPFTLHLKDFRHEIYPGTDIPRHFSSLVRLRDPEKSEDRDVLISMNQPLRYGGLTFYQASFGRDDTLSILQVVRNPGWLLPYISCILVSLGLIVHFLGRMNLIRWGRSA